MNKYKIATVCLLLSFNCLAREFTNECGQTRSEWMTQDTRCMEISDGQVSESFFGGDVSVVTVGVMTIEELEEQWELAE